MSTWAESGLKPNGRFISAAEVLHRPVQGRSSRLSLGNIVVYVPRDAMPGQLSPTGARPFLG